MIIKVTHPNECQRNSPFQTGQTIRFGTRDKIADFEKAVEFFLFFHLADNRYFILFRNRRFCLVAILTVLTIRLGTRDKIADFEKAVEFFLFFHLADNRYFILFRNRRFCLVAILTVLLIL